jgi:hypothetical protein
MTGIAIAGNDPARSDAQDKRKDNESDATIHVPNGLATPEQLGK